MKAVVIEKFGHPGFSSIKDVPQPTPGQDELLIQVKAAPVNFVDSLVFAGSYQFLPELPFTPGKGPTGVVIEVGEGVTDFACGDRVLAMAEHGGYAELALVRAQNTYHIPKNVSFEASAAISLAYDTAWFSLIERGRCQPGEVVLVLGASGAVGGATVQLAKAKGAKVLAAISSKQQAEELLALGADSIIDLSQPNLENSLREQVFLETNGKGADVVIDPLGGNPFEAAIRAVAWRGRFVVVGFATGRIPKLKMNYVLLKNIEISGIQISDYRKRCPEMVREAMTEIFELASNGEIKLPPCSRLPLSEYVNGLQLITERKARGRVVLIP